MATYTLRRNIDLLRSWTRRRKCNDTAAFSPAPAASQRLSLCSASATEPPRSSSSSCEAQRPLMCGQIVYGVCTPALRCTPFILPNSTENLNSHRLPTGQHQHQHHTPSGFKSSNISSSGGGFLREHEGKNENRYTRGDGGATTEWWCANCTARSLSSAIERLVGTTASVLRQAHILRHPPADINGVPVSQLRRESVQA
mmetsp:Transcript_29070/g.56612  ORF Transcript_29070/g.56612 Transcript_29070/m.56612 type:complete len:199 (-) Transcript_29070:165-761(-)